MMKIAACLSIQMLHINSSRNILITCSLLQPGTRLRKLPHTRHDYAWRDATTWKYDEFPEVSAVNSYLFEPVVLDPTPMVKEDNRGPADMAFVLYGSHLKKDDQTFQSACKAWGLPRPEVIGLPLAWLE